MVPDLVRQDADAGGLGKDDPINGTEIIVNGYGGAGAGTRLTHWGSLSTVPESLLSPAIVGAEPTFMATLYSPPLTTEPLKMP